MPPTSPSSPACSTPRSRRSSPERSEAWALPRRRFLELAALATGGLPWFGCATVRPPASSAAGPPADLGVLPRGPEPGALVLPHFPSRLHAFVWRNWSLVPLERMAAVVGARPAEVRALGARIGLGAPPRITRGQQRRSYITVIKRNWHLLPYDQLLALLGWSAEDLAFTLREDDFLWIKLGSLKPACEPLRWEEPDAVVRSREQAVARVVAEEFGAAGDGGGRPAEPLFHFVEALSSGGGRRARATSPSRAPSALRFCYSYFALYGDPLLEPDLDPFPDGYLERLADAGVTGVWLQGLLSRLAPFPWQPGLSARHDERRRNLATLVARAKRHGIRCFLYLNEPRALPLDFFASRPELKGVDGGGHATLCTSVPEVRRYLTEATASLCRAVPDLGGFLTITASENLTNCWSHGGGSGCPRCRERGPAEVIAEVNACLWQGILAGGHDQALLAWDWGWADAWAPDAIARLPDGVALMSVSEWSLALDRGGVRTTVGEYSLSAVGPGPRAQRHWALAKARGLKAVAKIQANNTWELSALPYLPVLNNVAEHAANLRRLDLDGIMLGWTLGGCPSPNLETIATVMEGGRLEDVALRRFGAGLAPAVLAAWREGSIAFREFPYDAGVVYSAPLQTGPANLLWSEPTHYRATMVGFPYDHLDAWRGPYPTAVFVAQLEKVAAGFHDAAGRLEAVLNRPSAGSTPAQARAAEAEASLARAAGLHFASVAAQVRFVDLRDRLAAATDREARLELARDLEGVIRDELDRAKALYGLQSRDSRIGFEATNHYFYVPSDLVEKVLNCRRLLDEWLPAQRAGRG